ncbi:MAG: phytase, partial [Gammaproteobacteria bacterium]
TQFLAFAIAIEAIPAVLPAGETPRVIDQEEPIAGTLAGDADDPAIWLHPSNPARSLVITALKDGGLAVFDLKGQVRQIIRPAEFGTVRYNNADIVYNFKLDRRMVDLAVASDRENDTLAIFRISPGNGRLKDITSAHIPGSIFGLDDGELTAYGLATYTSPKDGAHYVFVSQREGNQIAQLELLESQEQGRARVQARIVRSLTVPIPQDGKLEDAQAEGMVADQELGLLYVGQEQVGIWKFDAEPDGSAAGTLVDSVENGRLAADVEGLTLYYAGEGKGYLLASSQGDSTFAVYRREGTNTYLGSFYVGARGRIDGVEECDGAQVLNVRLGAGFPAGLLVVQDGANEPQRVIEDDEALENISTGFKFIPWQRVANAFPTPLEIDTASFNPRRVSNEF